MKQKREYLRIDDFISFEYSYMERAEYERVKNDYLAKTKAAGQRANPSIALFVQTASESKGENEALSDMNSPLIPMLLSLDKKLDMIISLLDEKGEKQKMLQKKTIKVNIGGMGLRFPAEEQFKKGDILELKMGFPLVPPVNILALGEVVRTEKEQGEEQLFQTAIKFAVIDEEDRERIIRYIFQRQRESIRAEKQSDQN